MMRFTGILAALALTFATTSFAAEQKPPLPPQACAHHVPYGIPQIARPNTQLICRTGYFLQHDSAIKIPLWVSYRLEPARVNGCVPRSNAFAPDQSIPRGARAEMADYAKSGYDIGHVAPNAEQSWDPQVEIESFYLSNMMPQLPGLNRGIWKLLETSVRGWTLQRGHAMIIHAGPIFDERNDKRIGPNGVIVPNAFYKIVIDSVTGETLAFLFPHQGGLGNDLSRFQVSIADIEQLTGIRLGLPRNMPRDRVLPLWPVDFKQVTDSKRAACSR